MVVKNQKKYKIVKAPAKDKKKEPAKKMVDKEIKKKEHFHNTKVVLSKGIEQLYPDRLFVKMRNYVTYIPFSGGILNGNPSGNVAQGVLGNGLYNSLTANAITGAGGLTFATSSSIAGLLNLISPPAALVTGGTQTAPYQLYRIHSSRITVKLSTTTVANDGNFEFFIIPVTLNTALAMGGVNTWNSSQLAEQPYAKQTRVSTTTINKGVKVSHAMGTGKMFGLEHKSSLESGGYNGTWNSNPATNSTWAWALIGCPCNATTGVQADMEYEIEYTVEFYSRNILQAGHL